jgi:Skp family chaperone for outer membrane proteins
MKTRYASIGLVLLFMGALASMSFAQQPKIGVVNSQDVLEKSTEGKRIIARLQEADKTSQAAIVKLDDEIRSIQTKLNTQRITLTEEAVMQMTYELDRKNTDRKRKAEDAYTSINELRDRLFKRLQDELVPLVEQVGKEKGMDIIFDLYKSGAVYWNPAIDFTAEVIKRYDASKATGK